MALRSKPAEAVEHYRHIADKYRPSHADFTYEAKYGIRDWQGGGRRYLATRGKWVVMTGGAEGVEVGEVEIDRLKGVLQRDWALDDADLSELVAVARDSAEANASLHQQIALIKAVARVQPKTVVVLNNGAPVASATVTVRDESTGLTRSTETNSSGQYTVRNLPVGAGYTMTVSGQGYAAERRDGVAINLGRT